MQPPPDVTRAQRLRQSVILIAIIVSVAFVAAGQITAGIIFSALCWINFLLGTLRPNSNLFGPVITNLETNQLAVALTIDDGPDPRTTPVMLDLLRRHEAKATFFLIGERAQAHPDLVKAIADQGHAIGNHSLTHPSGRFWALGPAAMWRQIHGCHDVLQHILGKAPILYRSPVGHTNPFIQPILDALGLRRIGWTARGYDAVLKDVDAILDRIRPDLKPGAIILLHEATDIAEFVLERLLEELRQRGLRTTTLPSS